MKLHRIDILNLNSLYGEHAIDFDGELGAAGLFLIQGQTGSGKSTIMDAVSLALFGETPRLANKKGQPPVAGQIMSRGTGIARACVEFSKIDIGERGRRVRYRATWAARRAGARADGKMQHIQRSLEQQDPGGQWRILIADHRIKLLQPKFTEVLEGFTPKDFQRAMLLAQGRFDALLHATPTDRAAILERLTDTQRYETLGAKASLIAAAWRRRIDALQQQINGIGAPDPALLEEARAVRKRGTAERRRLRARQDQARAWLDWLRTDDALQQTVAAAEVGVLTAQQEAAAAAGALARLAEHERCAAAFQRLDAAVRARADHSRNHDAQLRLRDALPALQRALTEAKGVTTRVAERHARLRDAIARLRPLADRTRAALDSAQALRRELKRDEGALARAEEVVHGPQGDAARADGDERAPRGTEAQLAARRRDLAAAEEALRTARATAAALAADEALASALPTLESDTGRLLAAEQATATARQALADRTARLSAARQQLGADQATHERTRGETLSPLVRGVEDASARLQTELGAETLPARRATLEATQEALHRRANRLADAGHACRARDKAAATAEEAAARLATTAADRDSAERAVQAALAATQAADRARGEAEAAVLPLRRIAALGSQRAELVDDEPCPLCGGLDHPYVADDAARARAAAIDSEVAAAEATLKQATEVQAAKNDALMRAKEAAAGAASRAATLGEQAQTAQRRLAEASDEANERLRLAELPEAAGVSAVEAAGEEVQRRLSALAGQRAALDAAVEGERQAKERLDTARAALERTSTQLKERAARLDGEQRALAESEASLQTQLSELTAQKSGLAAAYAAFSIAMSSATAARTEARRRANAWRVAQEGAQRAAAGQATARAQRDAAEEAHQRALQAVADAQDALTRRRAQVTSAEQATDEAVTHLTRAWQTLRADTAAGATPAPSEDTPPADALPTLPVQLTAQPVDWRADPVTPTRALDTHLTALASHLQRAEAERAEVERRHVAAEAQLQQLQAQGDTLSAQRAESEAALIELLSELSLVDEAALTARRLDDHTLRQLRARRDTLAQAQTQAAANLTAAQQQRARHQDAKRNDLAAATAPVQLALAARQAEAEAVSDARPAGAPTSEDGTQLAAATPPDETQPAALTALLHTRIAELAEALRACESSLTTAQATLQMAARSAAKVASLRQRLSADEGEAEVWLELHKLIGVDNGKRFKEFAQALNLAQLLGRANAHLQKLNDRYRLQPVLDKETGLPTLEFEIEDRWRLGARRSIKTLSGGESFLVSLALALGLSDLGTRSMPVETLLLDEGFGTLDPNTLQTALSALEQLQSSGRQVGIISHVVGLEEYIGARVLVEALGEGRSRVRVPAEERATRG